MEYIFEDRALVLREAARSVMIVTDIHIGYEMELLERAGVEFPPQSRSMYKRLVRLIEDYKAEHLYLMGDIKHSIGIDRAVNWREIPDFIEGLNKIIGITVIPGNHDGDLLALLPRDVVLGDVRGETLEMGEHKIGILHGHAWPSSEILDNCETIVMGHNHPTVRRWKDVSSPMIGRPDRKRASIVVPVVLKTKLSRNCVRKAQGQLETDDNVCGLIILPSFNELLTGVNVNRPQARLQGPFFENNCASLKAAEVYSSSGILLGSVESLQSQFDGPRSQRND